MEGSEALDGAARHEGEVDADAVRSTLHHVHLPKLAEAGWIEYDFEDGTIQYEHRIETVRSALRTAADELGLLREPYEERPSGPDSR